MSSWRQGKGYEIKEFLLYVFLACQEGLGSSAGETGDYLG